MLSHYQMKEIPYLRILGRTNGSLEPVTLFWTASGIELNVKSNRNMGENPAPIMMFLSHGWM